jgi:biopolymer transport protein ExbB
MLQPGSTQGAMLKNMATVKNSPLMEAFELGMQEIAVRFKMQDAKGQAHGLSASAVDSIRATLDALMLRVSQRLNSGIVLLTISISGGPFLGLLGTVVGVMITFAAIAAAGDVNVNAIAPGIAAALVATVAGLAVAIPALFAYNWFAIQIKNISSDLAVFCDEFLTRSAELHND